MHVEVGDVRLPRLRVDDHRAELEDPERPLVLPHPHLPEEDRPARVDLDRDRGGEEDRRQDDQAESRSHDVEAPLEEPRGVGEVRRREPDERDALDRVELGARPEHLEHPRDDVDLHPLILEQPDHVERLLVRIVREGDDHAIDPVLVDELPDLRRRPEQLERRPAVLHGAPVVVDEADDVEPVAAVLAHLLGEQPRDVARADDEDVLHVGGLAPADHSDEDAEEPDEPDRERPEHHEPLERRMSELHDVRADEEDPGSDRDHLEDAEEVVDGRVIGALLVTVVQPMQARENHPQRQARAEQDELPLRHDGVDGLSAPRRSAARRRTRSRARRCPRGAAVDA